MLEDRVVIGLELIEEMEDQVIEIRQRLTKAQYRKNSYADVQLIETIKMELQFLSK